MKIKSFVISAFLIMLFITAKSQVVVDGVNINELKDVKVCQIVATGKLFSNKVTINVDYGQFVKFVSTKGTEIKGADGKPVKFNSTIDAINHMINNGWEYIESHALTVDMGLGGKQNVYHFYFRRKES